jgi:methionyl-tRNA formyltransferase
MKKFLFVGSRRFVLDELLKKKNIDIDILAIKNTHLHRDLEKQKNIKYHIISTKEELLDYINKTEFDVLLSNGCPFILPINKLKKAKYANIHPSYLPDLKGIDPVVGSIKFSRDCGATCHLMNEKIDDGPIISRVKIPFSTDLDAIILYQLSFIAEKDAFNKAFDKNFVAENQQEKGDWIYYSRKPSDRNINLSDKPEKIIQNIKAFANKNQGCFFMVNEKEFKVHSAEELTNPFLVSYSSKFKNFEVIFCLEDILIFKIKDRILKFSKVDGEISAVKPHHKVSEISNLKN